MAQRAGVVSVHLEPTFVESLELSLHLVKPVRTLFFRGSAMSYRKLPLGELLVNRSNDRHGELENETAAIAWLFNSLGQHMKNLAKDIVKSGGLFEPPLVAEDSQGFVVFDGNRRVTCLKLLENPRRAPTIELQEEFVALRSQWKGDFPAEIECQVESDRDHIDDILFRRHTGSQSGVGQSTWDDRMKATFVNRTGKGGGPKTADEIERRLSEAGMLPRRKIPRANLNRLLSAEALRNRVGFSMRKGSFEYTHAEPVVLRALKRISDDLAGRKIVLGDIWDTDGKRRYLDELDREGALPTIDHALAIKNLALSKIASTHQEPNETIAKQTLPAYPPQRQSTLIPNTEFSIIWTGQTHRHKAIWEELQFRLRLSDHPNAISVLFRVLLDLSAQYYIERTKLNTVQKDTLAHRVKKVAEDLFTKQKINKRSFAMFDKFAQHDSLISADTLNGYVHSANFAPSPEHLRALWDALSQFIVLCLNAPEAA